MIQILIINLSTLMKISLALLLLAMFYTAQAAYNTKIALELGYMSYIAYEKQSAINAWSCSICSQHPVKNPTVFYSAAGGDIQGFTAYSTALNAIIISFRGSADLNNWITDFKAAPINYPKCSGCQIHDGFYKGYLSVASIITRNVQNLKALFSNAPIYITGHSLGAALAMVCAAEFSDTYTIANHYNFGQPRVGNPQFAAFVAPRVPNTFRLIDYADIVPHLPPQALNFQHSNTEVWYQRGMQTYQLCAAEAISCANSISPTQYSGGDHNLENYLKLKLVTLLGTIEQQIRLAKPLNLLKELVMENLITKNIRKD